MKRFLLLFCCFFCLGFMDYDTATDYDTAIVSRIIDGDTIEILHKNSIKKIRLYGIDAPETNQIYGEEATEYLKKITPIGSNIFIDFIEKDFFGRHIAIVKTEENIIVQELILSNGYAWIYKKYCSKKWEKKWIPLEKNAQKKQIGLFQNSKKIPPWIWRKLKK